MEPKAEPITAHGYIYVNESCNWENMVGHIYDAQSSSLLPRQEFLQVSKEIGITTPGRQRKQALYKKEHTPVKDKQTYEKTFNFTNNPRDTN